MYYITIEQKGDSVITDLISYTETTLLHKQIEYKNHNLFIRVWKRKSLL